MKSYRLITVFLLLLVVDSCKQNDHNHDHADTYTCPMHPEITSDKPGACPVCGMDLVKRSGVMPDSAASVLEHKQGVGQGMASGVNTINGSYKTMDVTLNAQGVVTYDTRFVYTISSRVGGRLDGVTTKYDYQQLQKGEKLVDIYSPELVTAQREYLFILENETDPSMIEGGERKLKVMGFTESQIKNLSVSKNILYRIPIYSPYSGYVISSDSQAPAANATASSATPPPGGMGMGPAPSGTTSQNSISSATASEIIREGQYVQSGQALVKVVSADALRIELNLPSAYSSLINKGENVYLNFGNGHSHNATIDFVEPFFSQGQEFLKVRVYTRNIENMHIGHLVDAQIQVTAKESLWIPRSSIVNLGVDQVVFIKEAEVFKPQRVSAGIESNDWVQIKSGLTDKDAIAANASYLVDSESFIRLKQ